MGEVRLDRLRELVGTIEPGDTVHLVGANQWHVTDLIGFVQEHTGPAELWAAVYSFSEPAARAIKSLKDQGRLTAINLLINHHQARIKSSVTASLAQICDRLSVYPNHAKVYSLIGETRGITIESSANMTSCPWLEQAVVTCSMDLALYTRGWIQQALDLAEPFHAETMVKSTRAEVVRENAKIQNTQG